ncbi:MAG: hypothetical protein NTW29_09085 [Bacteroidetes bacterium]|nr:hypothetical protein [Bacteroidota bacterium]
MDDRIRALFNQIKSQLESNFTFTKSEIKELNHPTIMGNEALYLDFETETSGIAIFFWESGAFEITADLIETEDGNTFYESYFPDEKQNLFHPEEPLEIFKTKLNDLFKKRNMIFK